MNLNFLKHIAFIVVSSTSIDNRDLIQWSAPFRMLGEVISEREQIMPANILRASTGGKTEPPVQRNRKPTTRGTLKFEPHQKEVVLRKLDCNNRGSDSFRTSHLGIQVICNG